MTVSRPSRIGAVRPAEPVRAGLLLVTFVSAVFVSAALLFAVQPMFTKMVVPRLGGAASVWSVAMVFFQATLLAGYAYAHLLARALTSRASVIVHLAVLASAVLVLPLHVAEGWDRPPETGESIWLLIVFAASIGLPFFALAANGPLLQAWFARSGHPRAVQPYFLYAASNAGSFLALVSYPIVVEPLTRLGDQTRAWTVGYLILLALIAGCGAWLRPVGGRHPLESPTEAQSGSAPSWSRVGRWVGLAAVPSGFLIAVTTHISTDLAAVPMLWILPLALYLLTFVIVFQLRPLVPHELILRVFPFAVVTLAGTLVLAPIESIFVLILLHLSCYFVITMMCHGELAASRPAPEHLTSFYMWISAGGAIGGILTGLAAPHLFNWLLEYPLLLILSVLCLPNLAWPATGWGRAALLVGIAAGLLAIVLLTFVGFEFTDVTLSIAAGVLLGFSVYLWRAPLPFAALLAFAIFGLHVVANARSSGLVVRNFYGVLNVGETQDGRFRVLWHGSIAQGAQRIRDAAGKPLTGRPELISEFQDGAGFAQAVEAAQAKAGGPISFAVIGLGTGALTCRARPGDKVTFYEINPDIVRIARDPSLFSFLSECGPDTQIVLGDARLTLADAPDASFDLIVVDAFISASIPTHLLTREALTLYLRKLKPGGFVAMHISNKYLELAPVVAGIADANGAIARVYDGGDVLEDADEMKWVPRIAAVARRDEDFGVLAGSRFWPVLARDLRREVWTDDYCNIFGALWHRIEEPLSAKPRAATAAAPG